MPLDPSFQRRRSGLAIAALLATTLLAAPAAHGAPADRDRLPETHVQDLHYGDVLFYVYQGEDLEAITRLNAYERWGLMTHHTAESQLLLGGLYLSLGLHNEAGRRFEEVLTADTPIGVRNRAWFYLAKVWYARGYLERAEQAIGQVRSNLPTELEAEKQHLHANILLRLRRFDEAAALLRSSRGPSDWMAYARFNLGVALIRENQLAAADLILADVGLMKTSRRELLVLKDRANLALGFAHLQAGEPNAAIEALHRVRLDGPYSNKALLGTGWAEAALGRYVLALGPWLELRGRNLVDAAVQEAYLAVPYAYAQLGASAHSAEYYEQAVTSFDSEAVQLDQAIKRIKSDDMLDTLLAQDAKTRYGWFWQLKNLPDAPESRYLYAALAGHDFQEGLKNYRDLSYFGRTFDRWADSMDAFGNMIETREHAYAEHRPRADAMLGADAIERHRQSRDELEGRLNAIEAGGDVAALGSPEEREQWTRIQRIEAALASAPDNDETAALRERLRLAKGVLQFRLNDSFKARMWRERRSIKDLDLALQETQARWIRVERARQSVPTNTGEFAGRVAALQQRIDALRGRLADAARKQNAYLAQLAVQELEGQKDRLATYQFQARFALATMYDRAAGEESVPRPEQPIGENADETDGASEPKP